MISHKRRAGVSIPLFSLRSRRSWGIGEIGDISVIAGWLRSARQSVLQILPMNEMAPAETSPYSALSGMAIDPQFVSIWMLDAAPAFEEIWRSEIDEARRALNIDYVQVRRLKARALKACFDRFYETEWLPANLKAEALRAYISREDWWLKEYSLYRAIRAREGERPWSEWPAPLRDREPGALATAAVELAREILYYRYVQWIAAEQWQAARASARGIEILGDLPFAVALDSADVWSRRHEFLLDASVGTPPDPFSAVGQEWGFPPYNWEEARKNGFAWIRMRARRFAELYDGFRIDHLVGFYRTYVRPLDGASPYFLPASAGEQVALGEDVMRIMIETGADISVEDLGVVPDFVRASTARLGLPGYRVLRWERGDPAAYPALSVALTGTHDTEPLATWWEGLAPDEQRRFGLESPVFTAQIRDTLIERIYTSGSTLVLLPIQDAFGWRDRINQPATVSHANWTYVLPWPVDEMPDHHEASECAARLAELSHRTGRWAPELGEED